MAEDEAVRKKAESEATKENLTAHGVASETTDLGNGVELRVSNYMGSPEGVSEQKEPLALEAREHVVFPFISDKDEEWRGGESGAPSGMNWNEAPDVIRDAVSSKTLLNSIKSSSSEGQAGEEILEVIERFNQEDFVPVTAEDENVILAPSNDSRLYRCVTLENQLRVLVISDATVGKCGAALSVNAGYMMDPRSQQGLAHAVAHALFADEKCGMLGETNNIVEPNDKNVFKRTSADSTLFSISTHPSRFYFALKTLADHIAKADFSLAALDYANDCIQSVLQERIFDDEERRHHLDKFLSTSSHPYSHSNYGFSRVWMKANQNTYLRQAALTFYHTHYSANRMNLVLVGQQKVSELEKWAAQIFAVIKNRNIPILSWNESPYGPHQLSTKVEIVPVKEIRSIQLIFPVQDCSNTYKAGITQYIKSIIMYQGNGSLAAYLREQQWAKGINAVYERPGPNFAFFKIDIALTLSGIQQAYSVVHSCFKYLEFLRVSGPQRWYWDQMKRLADIQLKYAENQLPIDYAVELAENFKFYLPHHVVCGKHLIREYLPKKIQSFLSALVPGNMRMIVTAKENLNFANETEEILGVKYKYTKLSGGRLKKWISPEFSEDLRLPLPNPFIPNSLEIKPLEKPVCDTPRVIEMRATHSIWYLQGRTLVKPVATILLALSSPLPSQSPQNMNGMCLMLKMLENMLLPVSYDAQEAGIFHNLEASLSGLRMTVHGFDDTVHKYLKAVIGTLFQVHSIGNIARYFAAAQEDYVETLNSWQMEGPSVQALQHVEQTLHKNTWSPGELLKSLRDEEFTPGYFCEFVRQFLKALKLVWFFYGNFREEEARNITDKLMQKFGELDPPVSSHITALRLQTPALLSNVATVIKVEHRTHALSACVLLLQTGEGKKRDIARTEILCAILQSAAEKSRGKHEKSHRLHVNVKTLKGFSGIYLSIQDDGLPAVLEANVEEFLLSIDNVLRRLGSTGFKTFRQNYKREKMEEFKSQSETVTANNYFEEILSGRLAFHKDEEQIEEIERTEYDHLLEIYDKHVCPRSQQRRKLTVLISSTCKREDVINLQNRSAQALIGNQNEVDVKRVSSSGSNHQNIKWADNLITGKTLPKVRKKHSESGFSCPNQTSLRVGQILNVNKPPSGVFRQVSANQMLKYNQPTPQNMSRNSSKSLLDVDHLGLWKAERQFHRKVVSLNERLSTSRNNNNKAGTIDSGVTQTPKSAGRQTKGSIRKSAAQSTSTMNMKSASSNSTTTSLKPVRMLANQKAGVGYPLKNSSNQMLEAKPLQSERSGTTPGKTNPKATKLNKSNKPLEISNHSNKGIGKRQLRKSRNLHLNNQQLGTVLGKLQDLQSSESTQQGKATSRREAPTSSRGLDMRPKTVTINAEKSQTVLLNAINKKAGSDSGTLGETFDVCDFEFDFDTEIKRLQTLKRWLQLSGSDKSGKLKSQLNIDLQIGFAALPLNYDPQHEIARLFTLKHTLEEATLQISKGKTENTEMATQANSQGNSSTAGATREMGRCKTILTNSKQQNKQQLPTSCSIYDVEKEITRLTQIKRFFDGHIKDLCNTEYTIFSQLNIVLDNPKVAKEALKACTFGNKRC